MKTLGQFVQDYRHRNGLNKSEMGELCSTTGTTIGNIEAGGLARSSTLEKLATGMKVSLRQLHTLPIVPIKSNGTPSVASGDVGAEMLTQFYAKMTPEQRLKLLKQAMEIAVGMDMIEVN